MSVTGIKPEGSFAPSMAELKRREIDSDDLPPRRLKDRIDHWVEVIDEWVERHDQGMGGTAQGADPEVAGQPPDPAPGRAFGTG